MSDADLASTYLADLRARFAAVRQGAERAAAQVDERQFFASLDPESNSIAVVMKHMAGNLRSRFTDFLVADGEKPDRNRDREFEIDSGDRRDTIEAAWAVGWGTLEGALATLHPDDLLRTVRIRGEAHTVLQALQRQLAHHAMHGGQIILLAKHWAGTDWRTLSIPRGGSAAFNARMNERR